MHNSLCSVLQLRSKRIGIDINQNSRHGIRWSSFKDTPVLLIM